MTPDREISNHIVSIHRRLLKLAREQGVDFNLILHRYAVERFLHRLAHSSELDHFTLKGASLLLIWTGEMLRPTRDIDFLGMGSYDHEAIRAAMESICAVSCPEDGVAFDTNTIRINDIREEQEYGGTRVRLKGNLGQARLSLQVDIGFGDVLTPDREEHEYPTLLGHDPPRLWTYPRETFVAEKLEAMVRLGQMNSRVKDFWDIACLARRFAFDGETLLSAFDETFRRRGTELAEERPEALQPAYYQDEFRARRWHEFQRQVEVDGSDTKRLVDIGEEVRSFLAPVCDSLMAGESFAQVWAPGGPWEPEAFTSAGEEADA